MTRDDFSSGQVRDAVTHAFGHERFEGLIFGGQHEQHGLFDGQVLLDLFGRFASVVEKIAPLVHVIILSVPVPVQGSVEAVTGVLGHVIFHLIVVQESVLADTCLSGQVDAGLGGEGDLVVVGRAGPVHVVQKGSDGRFGLLYVGFDLAGSKMELVPKVGEFRLYLDPQRFVAGGGGEIRGTDAEDRLDEAGVVLSHAVDDGTSPVVATEDDLREV